MRIGELAARTGVSVRAIRHYESLGLITADRLANGYRDFGEPVVERVRNIRLLLDSGLDGESIALVGHCLDGELHTQEPCADAVALYEQRLALVERRASELLDVRDRLQDRLTELRAAQG